MSYNVQHAAKNGRHPRTGDIRVVPPWQYGFDLWGQTFYSWRSELCKVSPPILLWLAKPCWHFTNLGYVGDLHWVEPCMSSLMQVMNEILPWCLLRWDEEGQKCWAWLFQLLFSAVTAFTHCFSVLIFRTDFGTVQQVPKPGGVLPCILLKTSHWSYGF